MPTKNATTPNKAKSDPNRPAIFDKPLELLME